MANKTPTLPKEITDEITLYEETAREFLAGRIAADKFQRFRLQHGVYGQRQDAVQMIRIKIPLGVLNAEQIECIADLAETIAHNNAHITTRQDIQIHYVKLENTPDMMRKLAAVGLTTREACGNTVRNVTASPSAGVDPDEIFDVTPYAHAFTHHFLRNPANQNLPRKFKVAFDGGGRITALPMLHDLGFVARLQKVGGRNVRGFKTFVGGGLGSSPRVARVLHEFLPVEEMIPWMYAIIRIFDRYGERKIRSKARMKFLIDKWGFEKFCSTIEKERKDLVVDPRWNDFLQHLSDWEEKPPSPSPHPSPLSADRHGASGEGDNGFASWKSTNVIPQKQAGYSMAEIRLTTGDMNPTQMRSFADILRRYVDGYCRTFVHQNLLIRWIRNQDLPSLYAELKKISFVKKDAQTIYDVTACPGTDTCRLGIASSMGLARVLEERLYQANGAVSKVAKDLRIKISGCPNSCGQHHIANIGLYGGAIPINGRTVPAFQLLLGGDPGREMKVGLPIVQIPSKNVPDAVLKLVQHYADRRKSAESFNAFYARLGKAAVVKMLTDGGFLTIVSHEDRPELYQDWEDKNEFALQKGVIGECAGTMVDDTPPRVADGDEPLKTAQALLGHGEFASAANKAREALIKTANGLLYHRLVQTFNERETIHLFESHFGRTGILPQWKELNQTVVKLASKKSDEATAKEWVELAKTLYVSCRAKEPEVLAASPRRPAGLQHDTDAL